MKGKIKRLVATSLATSLLAVSAFAPAVSAAPPNWAMHIDNYAPVVKPGNNAGFLVTITNNGPSNISTLFLDDSRSEIPLIAEPSQGSCDLSGGLLCSFGALNAGASVTVLVAYRTPTSGSAFDVTFQANTNGATFADNNKKNGKGGTSRGDSLNGDVSVALNGNANFGGGYVLGSTSVANSENLTTSNRQSTRLDGLSSRIYATVLDGSEQDLCGTACARVQLGEASEVKVDGGNPQTNAFRITITIRGASLSNPKPSASSIVVVHQRDNGTVEIIGDVASERCDSATNPTNVSGEGCVIATYIGNGNNANLQIVIWTFRNGKFRGAV